MDAAEADYDAMLYKASGDLIPELQTKVPLLIWHHRQVRTRLRTHVLVSKCEELRSLLDRFQEWPQLLDPVLAALAGEIVDGFLAFVTEYPHAYGLPTSSGPPAVPLPVALCRLLYTLCKVRGPKVIVRLLNNEPRYIEPMLSCVRQWDSPAWEVKYIMYLWLSHLMLAPFELSTVSGSGGIIVPTHIQDLSQDLPEVAKDVLTIALQSIDSPSKERESAVLLLVRLALRRDMQALGLHQSLVSHCVRGVLSGSDDGVTVYHALGHLSLLYAITNLGADSEIAPFLADVYRAASTLAASSNTHHLVIRDAAPVRKMLIKIMRACITHAVKLVETPGSIDSDLVNTMLEESIQYYLDALGDKDSPVRMAASKALSVVALRLDESMSAEIVEAVLACLSENILVDDPQTGKVLAKTDIPSEEGKQMKRNVSAVDALKWHGLMLTLGHLLFRRSPPPHQLPDIIEALLLGLEFEQRSNVGTSIGIGVRDGACFGVWALARKYSTDELESIRPSEIAGILPGAGDFSKSILQLIAVRLVLSSCLDPSGNIRRGSSAALQELIGRHPDTIIEGIPVVQVVDYLAVARRSRAIKAVAVQAAALDPAYHHALLEALLDWRGARGADVDSRRWAASAMQDLCGSASPERRIEILDKVMSDLHLVTARNLGTAAGIRHGLLLSAAAVVRSFSDSSDSAPRNLFLDLLHRYDVSAISGNLEGRTTVDLEYVMEGMGTFLGALASLVSQTLQTETSLEQITTLVDKWLPLLNRSVLATEKDSVVHSCADAIKSIYSLMSDEKRRALISKWLDPAQQKHSEMLCRGRLATLAALHPDLSFDPALQVGVENLLQKAVEIDNPIEIKVHAMEGLGVIMQLSPARGVEICQTLCDTLIAGVSDYSNDQRGDIGSVLRLQALETVEIYFNVFGSETSGRLSKGRLLPHVVRLAMEKLNKVRHRAWTCLKHCWGTEIGGVTLTGDFQHPSDVSSEEYFEQLVPLVQIHDLQTQVVRGLSSSIGGGTEDVCRSASSALVKWILGFDLNAQGRILDTLTASLMKYLDSLQSQDDRDVVPALELIAFLLEQDFMSEKMLMDAGEGRSTWEILQRVHISNASRERLDALTRTYSALARISTFRHLALDRLTRQLLHRYPKVRNTTADALCALSPDVNVIQCDWNQPATANKSVVLDLRKAMKIFAPAK